MLENNYTKENIKNRMFKRAAALWEIRDVDHLDPIVKLMIEALAGEIFNLSGELNDVEDRLIEKLSRELTPTAHVTAKPSHAIVHAMTKSDSFILEKKSEFHYKDPIYMQKHDLRRIVYTPVTNVSLISGCVKNIIAGGELFAMNNKAMKEKIARPHQHSPVFNNTIWIGLQLSGKMNNLKNLSVYFDFPYFEDKHYLFQLLEQTSWSINNQPIRIKKGIYSPKLEGENQYFFDKHDVCAMLDKEVLSLYNQRFITVTSDVLLKRDMFSVLPPETEKITSSEYSDLIEEPLVWIKVHFPPFFDDMILKETFISINAFPVANKYLERTNRKIDQLVSIIPLPKSNGELFLAVKEISDSTGKIYHEQDYGERQEGNTGIYSIRRGGIERFSSSDAKQYLSRLMTLLRDESMAFTHAERDILDENANSMLKQVNRLEYKIDLKNKNHEIPVYIIVDHKEQEPVNVDVQYWLTNGPIANGLNAYEPLLYNKNDEVDHTSVICLTASKGGQNAPDESDRKKMFKHALISKGAVYSKEDIISYCMAMHGVNIEHLEVNKGYAIGKNKAEGIIKTIDIIIQTRKDIIPQYIQDMKESLFEGLRFNSPDEFNYRIFINSPNLN